MRILMMAFLAFSLSACGTKGKLKSPSQIEAEAAKKAEKKATEKKPSSDEDDPGEAAK